MVRTVLRGLWAEPRPAHAPVRVWRDWALVGGLVAGSVLELLLREDRAWAPLVLAASVVVALTLLWRRTHPLAAAAVAFGTMIAWDVARIVVIDATNLLTIAGLLMLPYALFRWGSGREAAVGLGIILGWLPVTHVADPTASAQVGLAPSEVGTVVGGYGFFLFSAALGASIRFHANTRVRDIQQAKLRQRNELARELHDAVGHHVSAIAIQAQAGRALAASNPDRALATLETIEEAASRTLEEMRAMVGVLREGAEPDFAPHPGLADIEQLARSGGVWPRVDVQMAGDFAGDLIGDRPSRTGIDDDFVARGFENVGAWIMGRNMFGPMRGPWADQDWKGWGGDNPPYHVPVFVLTSNRLGAEAVIKERGAPGGVIHDESDMSNCREHAAPAKSCCAMILSNTDVG